MKNVSKLYLIVFLVISSIFSQEAPELPLPTFNLDGNVSENTGPLDVYIALEGVKVFLQVYELEINPPIMQADGPSLIAPQLPTVTLDTATTDNNGYYDFGETPAGYYLLAFSKKGYKYKSYVGVNLEADTTVNVSLLPDDAAGGIQGTVTSMECPTNPMSLAPCKILPIEGCSITVSPMLIMPMTYAAPEPIMISPYSAVTDAQGMYSVDNVPIETWSSQVQVTAACTDYPPVTKYVSLNYGFLETVDFVVEKEYSNVVKEVADEIEFRIATNKTFYQPFEQVKVEYSVKNLSSKDVTYNFGGCQGDMTVDTGSGDALYHYLSLVGCLAVMSEITLAPGDSTVMKYNGWRTPSAGTGPYTITAWLVGYDGTKVSINIDKEKTLKTIGSSVLIETYSASIRDNILNIDLVEGGDYKLRIFDLLGKEINYFTKSLNLHSGNNKIKLNLNQSNSKHLFLSIQGSGLSELIRIR